jgi:transposase
LAACLYACDLVFWDNWGMAKGYRPVQRDQPFLLPPDMREWLPEDHPVHLVIEVVSDHLDTSVLHRRRKTGGVGRAGYDPDMLLTLLIWAYANRVTSSRQIEARCWSDVAFRVICAGDVPDHTVIARFRSQMGTEAAEVLFTQMLACCARLGMGQLGVIALDGTKIRASASMGANRDEETLRRIAAELAAEHAASDAAEDDLFGPGNHGGQVPPGAGRPRSARAAAERAGRIGAALAEIEAERAAARRVQEAAEQAAREKGEAYLAATGPKGNPPLAACVAAARAHLEKVIADRVVQLAELEARYAAGQPRRGRRRGVGDFARVIRAREALAKALARQARHEEKAAAKVAARGARPANMTDPESRMMKTRGGFVQGYNAQNVTSADGLIIATCLTTDPLDMAWYRPMTGAAAAAATLIAAHRRGKGPACARIGLVLADAGYLSEANLTAAGPDRLIAAGRHKDLEKAARDGTLAGRNWDKGPIAAMAARLATPEGMKAYRQRGHIAETPHGNIKHNLGFRQFTMRGKDRVTTEWALVTTVHNLLKAITTGHLTPQALATL